ncbi:unnamed protein product, partial [Amoebophrya sp. A120]|eukprot:GSA120T00008923001.1
MTTLLPRLPEDESQSQHCDIAMGVAEASPSGKRGSTLASRFSLVDGGVDDKPESSIPIFRPRHSNDNPFQRSAAVFPQSARRDASSLLQIPVQRASIAAAKDESRVLRPKSPHAPTVIDLSTPPSDNRSVRKPEEPLLASSTQSVPVQQHREQRNQAVVSGVIMGGNNYRGRRSSAQARRGRSNGRGGGKGGGRRGFDFYDGGNKHGTSRYDNYYYSSNRDHDWRGGRSHNYSERDVHSPTQRGHPH